MENETTSAAMQKLIVECDPNERIAFRAGFLSTMVIFSSLAWSRTQEDLESSGQINNAMGGLLIQSLDELRAGIGNLKSDPEELAPASPQLQRLVKNALDYAIPYNDIVGKFLERFEEVFKPASDKAS